MKRKEGKVGTDGREARGGGEDFTQQKKMLVLLYKKSYYMTPLRH